MRKIAVFTIVLGLNLAISSFSHPDDGAILGGIGTGKIEIHPDGRFVEFTMNHNPTQPINDPSACFAAIAVESGGKTLVKRLYQDDSNPAAIQTVRVQRNFPRAHVDYEDPALPVHVRLDALSPVIPGDTDHSCYPGVLFEYSVHNPTDKDVSVTLAMSWRNLIGQGGGERDAFDGTGEFHQKIYQRGNNTGILFQMAKPTLQGIEQNSLGEHALIYLAKGKEKTILQPLWLPETHPQTFQELLEKQEPKTSKEAQYDRLQTDQARPAAAVAAQQILKAGETKSFVFLVAWYMPHQIAKDGTDYGVYYTTRWNSIQAVIEDLSERRDRNLIAFEKQYRLNASIPDWLVDKMRNGMAVLARDGVFLADGKFSLLTSNPLYPGNLGSPEERLADISFFLQCFPNLLRAELELFTDCQFTDGEVPSAAGNLFEAIGNGNVPGGLLGNPDSVAAYVMLVYQYYLWTGDKPFLEDKYPHIRYALTWLMNHDANADSIPDGVSLWPWGKEGVTSLFSGSLALSAFRIGEELEQTFNDLEFQGWCRRQGQSIARNLGSQLWNGKYYNAFFDPTRPDSLESPRLIPGLLGGEWYALQWGWNSFFPPEHTRRIVQSLAQDMLAPVRQSSSPTELSRRYGFIPAFTGPLLLRYGFVESAAKIQDGSGSNTEPGWWSYYAALAGMGVDLHRQCLIVGPSLSDSQDEFSGPFTTPLFSGLIRYSRSALSGQQECTVEIERVPQGKEGAIQQIAFLFPQYTNVDEMILQVFHNGKSMAGQDFSRESLRVFGFQPALKLKEGDSITLLTTSKTGPRIVVDVQSRKIFNYGAKCRIETLSLPIPSVSFHVTNLLRERQMISFESINPAPKEEYAVFVNGEKRSFSVPLPEPIPMLLPLSPITFDDMALLQLTAKGCQEAAVLLASVSGRDDLKKKLWSLEEEVHRLSGIDAKQRGIRFDILPTSALDQFQLPKIEESGKTLREDLDRLNEIRHSFMEDIQKFSQDPILASELMGSFVPVEFPVSVEEIRSPSGEFAVEVRMQNPVKTPIQGRVTLTLPEGWRSISNDDVVFDDRAGSTDERLMKFRVNAPVDLWQNRYPMHALLSGTWNGYPFRKMQAAYVGHSFIQRWMILGPFPNLRGEGFGKMNQPEINIQLKETYPGIEETIGWSQHAFPSGYVDFDSVLSPNDNATAYAYTGIFSPREQAVQLRVGCSGDLKLFLNYQEIFAKRNISQPRPGGEIVTHRLYQGWNHLLVKLSERTSPWGFYFEVYDSLGKPVEGIQYALDQLE